MREMIFNFYILAGRRLRGGSGGANLLSWRNFSGCGLFRDFGLFGGRGDQNWPMFRCFQFGLFQFGSLTDHPGVQGWISGPGTFSFPCWGDRACTCFGCESECQDRGFWLFKPGGLDLDFCFLESHGNLVSRTEDHGEPDPFGEHGDTGALFTDFSIFLHFTHHSTTFRQDLEMVN